MTLNMKYYIQILILLIPAILFSSEWEKLDLPNLNNGKIRSVNKIDSIYVVEKQNKSILISTNLKEWSNLESSNFKKEIEDRLFYLFKPEAKKYIKKIQFENSWCVYSENGLLYYNQDSNYVIHEIYRGSEFQKNLRFNVNKGKIKSIQNRDKYLYFIQNDTLFTIDSTIISKVRIDKNLLKESFIIAFHYEDNLYVKSINNDFKSNNEKFYIVKDGVLIRHRKELTELLKSKFLKVTNLDTLEKQLGVKLNLPNNTYINSFWVKDNTIEIKPGTFEQTSYINLENMSLLESPEHEEHFFLKSNSVRFGNYFFRIINNWKDSATIEIYDSTFNEVKRFNFNYSDVHNNSCYIEGYFDNYIIIQSGGNRLKLDLRTLEYQSLFSAPNSVCKFSNKLIIKIEPDIDRETEIYLIDTSDLSIHSAIFAYSLDNGKSWMNDTLKGKVSDKHFNTCSRGENSHLLDVLGKTIYSFTKDTIFMAKIGQKYFNSLLSVKYEYHLKYNDKIYFLDYNTDKIYTLMEEGKFTSIKCPVNNVVNFCIDNGYLYAANNDEIFRLKIE